MTRRPAYLATLLLAAPLLGGFEPAQPVEWNEKGYPVWTPEQMALPALPAAPADAVRIDANLNGYVFGLKLIDADYDGWVGERDYAVRADLSTAGLGALVKKLRIWALTTGRRDAQGLHPETHTQQNRDKKRRRVEMDYDYARAAVDVSVIPPNGSQGVPPATPTERFGAEDTLTAMLAIMVQRSMSGQAPCEGTIPVFDSKQHYRLRMVPRGTKSWKKDGYRTQARRCDIYYEPVSGFDPEDLPDADEAATPIQVTLAPFDDGSGGGFDVPVRFTYKVSGFKAVIKLDDLTLTFPDGTAYELD